MQPAWQGLKKWKDYNYRKFSSKGNVEWNDIA
jgi:hypothetical protein